MTDYIAAFYELEKIVILAGKGRDFSKDSMNQKNLNAEQFKESVYVCEELVLDKENELFKKILFASTEKLLSIREHNLEYATSMRVAEWNALEEAAKAGISKLYFKMCDKVAYYFLYTN